VDLLVPREASPPGISLEFSEWMDVPYMMVNSGIKGSTPYSIFLHTME
jgi:hypothetical protein